MRRSIALASVSVLSVGVLAACSSDDSSSEEMVGGMTECTDEIINEEAQKAAQELGADNEWYPDSVECADGWAVAYRTLGEAGQSEPDVTGAPTNFVFQQEGQFWIPKDKEDVCGTDEDGSYPSDAEIPEALYNACPSG